MSRRNVNGHATIVAMTRVSLGQLVQRRRKQLDWSLREAARQCGMDPSLLLRIENDEALTPRPDTLTGLANGLGIKREELALAVYGEYLEPPPAPVAATA